MPAASTLLAILEQMANLSTIMRTANEAARMMQPPTAPTTYQATPQHILVDVDYTTDELVLTIPGIEEWRCEGHMARYAYEALDIYFAGLPRYYSEEALDILRTSMQQDLRAQNVYTVLGLDPQACKEVIDAAYKALARCLHPDRGGSEEAMSKLNTAYTAIKKERGWT